jgi:hypothetical protein
MIDAINKRLNDDNLRCLKEIPDWNRLTMDDGYGIVKCHLQLPEGKNTIAIIGDSHAGHLYSGLSEVADNDGVAAFPTNCAIPLIGLSTSPNSAHLMSEGFSYILSHNNIKKVIIAHSPWCSWGNKVVDTLNPNNHDHDSIIHDGFVRTFKALTEAGKEVYVTLDSPVYFKSWLNCKAAAIRRPTNLPDFLSVKNSKYCSVKQSEREDKEMVDGWNKVVFEAANEYKSIQFIDLGEAFCKQGICSTLDAKGKMLYRDESHFNISGSIYAAQFIIQQLRQ